MEEIKNTKSEDLTFSTLAFARALGYCLQENTGIVIESTPEMKKLQPNFDKVIVFRANNQLNIVECHDDLKDGQPIMFGDDTTIKSKDETEPIEQKEL